MAVRRSGVDCRGVRCGRPLADVVRGGPGVVRDLELAWRGLRQAPLARRGRCGHVVDRPAWRCCWPRAWRAPCSCRPVSARARRDAAPGRRRRGGRTGRISPVVPRGRARPRAHRGPSPCTPLVNLQPAVLRAEGADLQTMIEVVDGGYFDVDRRRRCVLGRRTRLGRRPAGGAARRGHQRDGVAPAVRCRPGGASAARCRSIAPSFTIVGVTAASGSASALGAGVDAWTPLAHADAVLNPGWRTDPRGAMVRAVRPAVDRHRQTSTPDLTIAARELAAPSARGVARSAPAQRARQRCSPAGNGRAVAAVVWILGGTGRTDPRRRRRQCRRRAHRQGGGIVAADGDSSGARRRPPGHRAAPVDRRGAAGVRCGRAGAARRTCGRASRSPRWRSCQRCRCASTCRSTATLAVTVPAGRGGRRAGAGARPRVLGDARRCRGRRRALGEQRAAGGATLSRTRRCAGLGASGRVVDPGGRRGVVLAQPRVTHRRRISASPRRGLVALDFDLAPAVAAERGGGAGPRRARRVATLPGVAGRGDVQPRARRPLAAERGGAAAIRPASVVGETTLALATEDYFATVGVPSSPDGRLRESSASAGDDVVIVNETMARRLWPEGRRDWPGPCRRRRSPAGHVWSASPATPSTARSPTPARRTCIGRLPPAFSLALLVRSADDPRRTLVAVQDVLDRVGPGVVGFFPRTMDDHLASELLPARVAAAAATGLGLIALSA